MDEETRRQLLITQIGTLLRAQQVGDIFGNVSLDEAAKNHRAFGCLHPLLDSVLTTSLAIAGYRKTLDQQLGQLQAWFDKNKG